MVWGREAHNLSVYPPSSAALKGMAKRYFVAYIPCLCCFHQHTPALELIISGLAMRFAKQR